MADCENSRCLVLPIVYPIRQMWRFDYEQNYTKVAQLRPPVTKMVIGSINCAQGNRIMSSFYHFAYCKLHTDALPIEAVGRRQSRIKLLEAHFRNKSAGPVYIRFIRKNIGRQTATRIHEQ